MKAKYIICYLLLLVLPAICIGVMATRLLRDEEARLRALTEGALRERAAVMAGHLDLILRESVDGLLTSLRQTPPRPDDLSRWAEQQPFARRAFLWMPPDRLLWPDAEWAGEEDRGFMQRYEALFSGRRQWPLIRAEAETAAEAFTSPAQALQHTRREVAQRARAAPMEAAESTGRSGVIPWFWERDIHWLVWIQSLMPERIYGVEVEHIAVYARFVPLFQQVPDGATAFALYDHHDQQLMASPDYDTLSKGRSVAQAPVGEWLPNWHVRAVDSRVAAALPFAVVSGLLVAILLTSILLGGGWLVWRGWCNHRDALRKTTFVSNVSHELKTPLTTIRMYAEMLKEGRVRDPAKQADYLRVMESESRRLTRLVNNVLDFSRLEQRRRAYHPARLDLNVLVRDAVSAHADRFEEIGLRVEMLLPAEAVRVYADRDAVEQVLLNLLDNAAKYALSGGHVIVRLDQREREVALRVEDRGPGVPAAHAQRIFNSFHRVDDSLTAHVPGAGLGLSIGRRLMRDQGGDLNYRDGAAGGAIFEMRFSRSEEAG